MLLYSLVAVSAFFLPSSALQVSAESLASSYSLATSTSFAFPTATQDSGNSASFITSQWSLSKGKIQNNADDIAFVDDPFPNSNSSSAPVLRVTYPQGSYSSGTGGTQFINLWNSSDGSAFNSMIASYEVAFDTSFDWVKGGKLPGIRGGLNSTGCSGGREADGVSCFSSRIMWRQNGEGEVYAYIPESGGLCSQNGVICNSDYGISLSRGNFSFTAGQWSSITMLVQLNNPPSLANGNIQLYFNNTLAINQTGLQIRTSSSLTANGLFFSTFFGGSDSSYATPQTTYTYFRNLRLWGGSVASELTGVTNAGVQSKPRGAVGIFIFIAIIYQLL